MIASTEMIETCCEESRLATEQWVAQAFVATNKRMDELIHRQAVFERETNEKIAKLERELGQHEAVGEYCPHTGV